MDTAARLFAERGYEATSMRAVARGAGVTPAMIAYYFQDKAGLLEAVVVGGLEVMLDTLRQAVAETEDQEFLPGFVRRYLATLSERPWLPQIIVREVISRQGPLRDLFIERFAEQALEIVPPRVVQDIAAGRLRNDLDPSYAMLSLLGMCVFPFIAAPVLGPMLGYRCDPQFGAAYAEHMIRLLKEGVSSVESVSANQ